MAGYDVVVMGGGHNQLGTAAYLAKAGKKVLVLEKKDFTGGGAVTLERTEPGFPAQQTLDHAWDDSGQSDALE